MPTAPWECSERARWLVAPQRLFEKTGSNCEKIDSLAIEVASGQKLSPSLLVERNGLNYAGLP